MEEKIKKILSETFKVPILEIDNNFSTHSVKNWDSLNHMKLILSIEKEFLIKLNENEIETMINFNIIKKTIAVHIDK